MTRGLSALVGLMLVTLTANCAGAPTGPTAKVSDLRWDITAPGCAPRLPVPTITEAPDTRTATASGVTARWLVFEQGDTRRYVVGEFVPVSSAQFGICSWLMLERVVDK